MDQAASVRRRGINDHIPQRRYIAARGCHMRIAFGAQRLRRCAADGKAADILITRKATQRPRAIGAGDQQRLRPRRVQCPVRQVFDKHHRGEARLMPPAGENIGEGAGVGLGSGDQYFHDQAVYSPNVRLAPLARIFNSVPISSPSLTASAMSARPLASKRIEPSSASRLARK